MEVSEALRRFRRDFGLTQDDVTAALGVNRQVYQPYETGRTLPSVKTILKIADAFKVSTDYLLGRSDIAVLQSSEIRDREFFNAVEACAAELQAALRKVVDSSGRVQDNQPAQREVVCRADATTD